MGFSTIPRQSQPQSYVRPTVSALSEGLVAAYLPEGGRTLSPIGAPATANIVNWVDPAYDKRLGATNGSGQGCAVLEDGSLGVVTSAGGFYYSSSVAAAIPFDPKAGFTGIVLTRPASSTPAAAGCIFGLGNSSNNNPCLQFAQIGTTGHAQFFFRDTAGATCNITVNQQLVSTRINRVAYVSDGVSSHLIRIGGASYTSAVTLGAYATSDRISLGSLLRSTSANSYGGSTSIVLIFNKVLSIPRIDSLLANPWQTLYIRPFISPLVTAGPGPGVPTNRLIMMGVG